VDTPLALCDARTVSAEDLVAADMYYPNRVGEIFLVHQSPRHRWVYFSEMDCREALVFKRRSPLHSALCLRLARDPA
jgi:hypothetical protein